MIEYHFNQNIKLSFYITAMEFIVQVAELPTAQVTRTRPFSEQVAGHCNKKLRIKNVQFDISEYHIYYSPIVYHFLNLLFKLHQKHSHQ